MNDRAASRAVLKIATPKNGAASCGVFLIPRKRDKGKDSYHSHINDREYRHEITISLYSDENPSGFNDRIIKLIQKDE